MPSETDGQLFDLSPLAMALLDPATAAIRAINPCGLKLLGKTRASLKDHSPMSLGWTSAANWQKLVSELQNGTRLDRRPFSLAGPADGEIEGVLSAALLRDDGPETIWFCFEDRAHSSDSSSAWPNSNRWPAISSSNPPTCSRSPTWTAASCRSTRPPQPCSRPNPPS